MASVSSRWPDLEEPALTVGDLPQVVPRHTGARGGRPRRFPDFLKELLDKVSAKVIAALAAAVGSAQGAHGGPIGIAIGLAAGYVVGAPRATGAAQTMTGRGDDTDVAVTRVRRIIRGVTLR
jgi:hypothetical protein